MISAKKTAIPIQTTLKTILEVRMRESAKFWVRYANFSSKNKYPTTRDYTVNETFITKDDLMDYLNHYSVKLIHIVTKDNRVKIGNEAFSVSIESEEDGFEHNATFTYLVSDDTYKVYFKIQTFEKMII